MPSPKSSFRLTQSFLPIIALLVLFFAIPTILQAYDSPLFYPISHQNLLWSYRLSEYDLSNNPAFFAQNYPDNLSVYRIDFLYQEKPFHRTFDPQERHDYQLLTYNINHLSEKIAIAAFIDYQRSDLRRMYRSLEKDFYAEYFALADTTTGNTVFDGPQVSLIYNYTPLIPLNIGLKIDYGVEHGIKDVFTKCETIMRNIDLSGGIGWNISKNLTVGLTGRYFNSQRKYEAVKELQDAQVKTYFGYHVYKLENPRSTNRKNDDRKGYEVGTQLTVNHFGLTGLQLLLAASQAAKATEVSVGSVSSPEKRGYGLSSGKRLIGNLSYTSSKQHHLALLYEMSQLAEWVEGSTYQVILLENEQLTHTLRFTGIWQANKAWRLTGIIDWKTIHDDYNEYIQSFTFAGNRQMLAGFAEVRWQINPILSSYCRGFFGKEEPFFYWNTSQISTSGVELGMERISLLGKFGVGLKWEQEQATGWSANNHKIGINLNYQR